MASKDSSNEGSNGSSPSSSKPSSTSPNGSSKGIPRTPTGPSFKVPGKITTSSTSSPSGTSSKGSDKANPTRKPTTAEATAKGPSSKPTPSQNPAPSGTSPKKSGRVVPAPIQPNPVPSSSEMSRTTSTSPTLVNSGPPSGKSSDGKPKSFDSTNEQHLALRPSYGTKGTSTKVLMNYVKLESTINQPIFMYSIDFTKGPNAAKSDKVRRLVELFLEELALKGIGPFFMTARTLPFDKDFKKLDGVKIGPVYLYKDSDPKPDKTMKDERYDVDIKYKRKISVSELSRYLSSIHGRTESKMDKASLTQALAIFTGLGFSKLRPSIFAFANRTDFSDWVAGPYTNPSLGLDPKGFYPSVRTSTLQMLVDSQHAASAFYYPAGSLSKLIDTYDKCFKSSPEKLPPGDLQSFLSGLRVSYSYLKDKVTKKPVTKFRKVRGIAPGRLNSEKGHFRYQWEGGHGGRALQEPGDYPQSTHTASC